MFRNTKAMIFSTLHFFLLIQLKSCKQTNRLSFVIFCIYIVEIVRWCRMWPNPQPQLLTIWLIYASDCSIVLMGKLSQRTSCDCFDFAIIYFPLNRTHYNSTREKLRCDINTWRTIQFHSSGNNVVWTQSSFTALLPDSLYFVESSSRFHSIPSSRKWIN